MTCWRRWDTFWRPTVFWRSYVHSVFLVGFTLTRSGRNRLSQQHSTSFSRVTKPLPLSTIGGFGCHRSTQPLFVKSGKRDWRWIRSIRSIGTQLFSLRVQNTALTCTFRGDKGEDGVWRPHPHSVQDVRDLQADSFRRQGMDSS